MLNTGKQPWACKRVDEMFVEERVWEEFFRDYKMRIKLPGELKRDNKVLVSS